MQNPEANVAHRSTRSWRERLWPGESALDRRIGFRDGDDIHWLRVVGVAPNVHYEEIGEDTDQSRLNVYVPYAHETGRDRWRCWFAPTARPRRWWRRCATRCGGLARRSPMFRLMPMRELRRHTTWEQEFFGDLMAVFAAGALLLACLGIYALISYSVGRRSREIGVRLALGARPADVIGMLLRRNGSGRRRRTGRRADPRRRRSRAPSPAASTASASIAWLFASMAVPLAVAIAAGDVGAGAPRRPRRAYDRAAGRVIRARVRDLGLRS